MNWLFSLYVAILFFILTPAVLLRIPKNGNKYTVAGVHAIIFALLLHFTGKFVWNFSMTMEGFQEGAAAGAAKRGATGTDVKTNAPVGSQRSTGTNEALQKKAKDDCTPTKRPGYMWDGKTCVPDPNAKAPQPKDSKVVAALQARVGKK